MIKRQPVQSRNTPQKRTPETHARTGNPPIEIEFNDFRPLTVLFGTQEKLILPPPDENRIRVPLRDEHHEREQQPNQTRTEDEDRMSSRPSRNNQSIQVAR